MIRMTRRSAIGAALLAALPTSGQAQQPREGSLKVGDPAPPFTLQGLIPETEVKLDELKGRPVVLIFGSCT